MTKHSGRKKRKYNPLNKYGAPATRKDFIETDYVNGVVNDRGEQVIRPLNKEEVEWLSQFYLETEHENFAKTSELEVVQEEYDSYCFQIRHAKKNGLKTEEVLDLKVLADKAYKELVQLRSETGTFYSDDKERREIYKKGRQRRDDIFNVAKASGKLVSYDVTEFDKFTTKAEKSVNAEHLILDYLTRKPAKKKVVRKKKVTTT